MITPTSSALDIAAAIRSGAVSPVEVADMYLDRIDARNDEVNAIVWLDREDALRRARESEARLRSGSDVRPFEGVPIPVKDLSSVAGQPNTMSSLSISETPATETDIDVRLLEEAGFVLLGRSNSPEFGPLTASENARHGKTRNPWDLEFTSGGSSGGASAAVAAGFAPIGHASDGGGSIRVPSSVTGLVGLKPSRGRVPAEVRGWEHSTTSGVITRTVADSAAALDVLSPFDPLAWYSAPAPARPFAREVGADPGRLRIGLLLQSPSGLPVDPENIAAAEAAARALEALGHVVEPVSPFLFTPEAGKGFVDVVISASVFASPYEDVEKVDPYIRYRIEQAKSYHSGEYAALAGQLQWETRQVNAQFGRDFDLLLTPTMATATPRVGVVYDEANETPAAPRLTEARQVTFTAWVNIAGLPAISLPVHVDDRGLPVGAQLVAGPFDEATLIRVAAQLEPVFDWPNRLAPGVEEGRP
ncbi:amidase [Leucobacter rhizosphaerae]|uniref:Amidase n=1 Tax=Leucobacter rhizosphaerae TaxID=2932245 RepID=A0ABY4FSB3_9MICO|nr:amidase [Leucobacter rhizosphaerae]UOQ59069.1 amidase [Leucobacter rhizosphaerae]